MDPPERVLGLLRELQTILTYFQMVLPNYRNKNKQKPKWILLSLIVSWIQQLNVEL